MRSQRQRPALLAMILLAGVFVVVSAAAQANGPQSSTPAWKLVWSDEFNGPNGSAVDSSKWASETGGGGWGNDELEYYTRRLENASQQDGNLVIQVLQEKYTGADGVTRNYTSARLKTQNKFSQAYGRFEARIKIPRGQGIWPAFWMLGTNIVPVGWPTCGEIDIMEKAWLTDHIQHALHWDGYSPSPLAGSAGLQVLNMGMNDGGWHVFGLDWTPTNYVFYVDGTQTYSTNAGGVSQVPEYVMLTEEVGNFGSGPDAWGTGPITNATLPDYYLVEYVRIYDTNEPQAQLSYPVLLNASNLVLSWSGGGNLLSATNLAGPWVVVTNAASPFTSLVAPNTPRQFFRVQQ